MGLGAEDARRFLCASPEEKGVWASGCADVETGVAWSGAATRFMIGENKLNEYLQFPEIKRKSNNLDALLRSVALAASLLNLMRFIPSQRDTGFTLRILPAISAAA